MYLVNRNFKDTRQMMKTMWDQKTQHLEQMMRSLLTLTGRPTLINGSIGDPEKDGVINWTRKHTLTVFRIVWRWPQCTYCIMLNIPNVSFHYASCGPFTNLALHLLQNKHYYICPSFTPAGSQKSKQEPKNYFFPVL